MNDSVNLEHLLACVQTSYSTNRKILRLELVKLGETGIGKYFS